MAPRKQPQPVPLDAVADHRERLTRLRDRLTTELDTAPPAYLAGLARQLQAVLNELASLPDPARDAESPIEAIRRRREARLGPHPISSSGPTRSGS